MNTDIIYRFSDQRGGVLGEIPVIEIWNSDDIPPLNKADSVHVHSLCPNELVRSEVATMWCVGDMKVWLTLCCCVDNIRFKHQCRQDPALAEKIIGLLLLPEQGGKRYEDYRSLKIVGRISKAEVSEALQSFVTQVEVWKKFFGQPHVFGLFGHHFCGVEEGYYMTYISAGALRLGALPFVPECADELEGRDPIPRGFDFDPKTEPPTVGDNEIYWTLEEHKVRVVLTHNSSNERIAAYYGYLDAFQRYKQERREKEVRTDAAHEANQAALKKKLCEQVAALRQTLLS